MTENQARGKRCCGPNGCGYVDDEQDVNCINAERWCIASGCAGWLWDKVYAPGVQPKDHIEGHCGLIK